MGDILITVWEVLVAAEILSAVVVVFLSLGLRWLIVHKFDKPDALGIAKDIIKEIKDPDSDATYQQYFTLFYRAIHHAKHKDPDESEWITAAKIFQEELLQDSLEKENGSETED